MDHFDFHRNLTWPQQLPSAENWKDGFSTKENIFIEKNRKFYCKLSNGIQVLTLLWKRHLKSRSRKNISFIDRVSGSTAVRLWKGSNSRSSVQCWFITPLFLMLPQLSSECWFKIEDVSPCSHPLPSFIPSTSFPQTHKLLVDGQVDIDIHI